MSLNQRKNKHSRFWAFLRKANLVGPKSLGISYKKKVWKRFLFSSSFWKKRAFSLTHKSCTSDHLSLTKGLLKTYVALF